jgi:hypothetical protein
MIDCWLCIDFHRHLGREAKNAFKIIINAYLSIPEHVPIILLSKIYLYKRDISRFEKNHISTSIINMIYFSKRLILSILIYMISTCAGIDKYAFYLDFKGVLRSTPQLSV